MSLNAILFIFLFIGGIYTLTHSPEQLTSITILEVTFTVACAALACAIEHFNKLRKESDE